jgi:hypothetical protein
MAERTIATEAAETTAKVIDFAAARATEKRSERNQVSYCASRPRSSAQLQGKRRGSKRAYG